MARPGQRRQRPGDAALQSHRDGEPERQGEQPGEHRDHGRGDCDRAIQAKSGEIIEFLDGYRVAEATAAAGFGAWIATSDTDCLRGGLRMVQLREAAHAKLFEERIKELGGSAKAEASEELEAFLIGTLGDPDKSDAEKLQTFAARAGDPKVIEQLEGFAARMDADQETQFLLRAVIQDERASLEFLHQACELLCSGSAS